MVEEIKLNQLTKEYITNHTVICRDIICVYRESWDCFTGRTKREYAILNKEILVDPQIRTLTALKTFIRKYGR